MDVTTRRDTILETIRQSKSPISASLMAKTFNVSRQVIVGDIALLRAQGFEIVATARGYIFPEVREVNQYLGKIACCHNPKDTIQELYMIVDLEAVIVDVIVDHELYGEITGQLNLKTRDDVDMFIKKVGSAKIKLLSELTAGVHLHTIACRDKAHFEGVYKSLEMAGYLFQN